MEIYIITMKDYANQKILTGPQKFYYSEEYDWFFDETAITRSTIYTDYDKAKSLVYFLKQEDSFITGDKQLNIETYVLKLVK